MAAQVSVKVLRRDEDDEIELVAGDGLSAQSLSMILHDKHGLGVLKQSGHPLPLCQHPLSSVHDLYYDKRPVHGKFVCKAQQVTLYQRTRHHMLFAVQVCRLTCFSRRNTSAMAAAVGSHCFDCSDGCQLWAVLRGRA